MLYRLTMTGDTERREEVGLKLNTGVTRCFWTIYYTHPAAPLTCNTYPSFPPLLPPTSTAPPHPPSPLCNS